MYEQWIDCVQLAGTIEFIDSNNLLIAGGHTWSSGEQMLVYNTACLSL